jgi:chromosome segregation ATPase
MDEATYRRSQLNEEFGQDGVEYAPSEEGDILSQLREKVRNQAQRLRGLENYRVLCEERISELCPGHPIPIKPEHLGAMPVKEEASIELSQAKQRIAKLELQLAQQQASVPLSDLHSFPPPNSSLSPNQFQELYRVIYYQFSDICKDKVNLEDSLRAEMLTSEEQRCYIEVLKQALEVKMEDLGMPRGNGKVDLFVDFTQFKASEERLRREAARLQSTVLDQETQIKRLNEQIKAKNEEARQLIEERSKLDQDLAEAADALQFAEEEVHRIEEEKSSLIDFAAERDAKIKEVEAEIERYRESYNDLSEKYKASNNLYKEEQERNKKLEFQIRKASNDIEQMQQIKASLESNEKRMQDKTREISSMKEQIKTLQDRNESLQANNTTLANTLRETQTELDNLQGNFDTLISEYETLKENYASTQNLLEKVEEERSSYQGKFNALQEDSKKRAQELQRKLKESEDKLDLEVKQHTAYLEQLKSELENSKKTQLELTERETQSNQEAGTLRQIITDLQDHIEVIEKRNNALQTDYLELKYSSEEAEQRLLQTTQDREELKTELQRMEFSMSSQNYLRDENSRLRDRIEELSHALRKSNENFKEKDGKLMNTMLEIDGLKRSIEDLERDKRVLVEEKQILFEDIRAYKIELADKENILEEFRFLKDSIECCGKIISNFVANFGAISTASVSYSMVISTGFKEVIIKWVDKVRTSPRDIEDWVRFSSEELEALIKRIADLKVDNQTLNHKLSLTQERLDNTSACESALRDKERTLKYQLDTISDEKSKLQIDRENFMQRQYNLQQEVSNLRKDIQELNDENQRLRDSVKMSNSETIQWKQTAETDVYSLRSLEEKNNLLLKEKRELELLVARLQSTVPSTNLRNTFGDIIRLHNDIEMAERERLRIENQLLNAETEMRSRTRSYTSEESLNIRREVEALRASLQACEGQLSAYRRKMTELEEQLKDPEVDKKRADSEEKSFRVRTTGLEDTSGDKLNFRRGYYPDDGTISPYPYGNRRYNEIENKTTTLGMESRLTRSPQEDRARPTFYDRYRQVKASLLDT